MLTVTANPRGHTAFVILGGPANEWYEDYAATRWALIDTDERTVIREGDLGIDGAEYAAFSPDGVHALVVGRQSQFVVIDTRTGKATVGPTGRQQGTIFYASYNRDGSQFVTGSDDQTARLWDASTGDQLGVIRIPAGTPGERVPGRRHDAHDQRCRQRSTAGTPRRTRRSPSPAGPPAAT